MIFSVTINIAFISDGESNTKIIENKTCVRSSVISPKKPGIVNINIIQRANIIAQRVAVRGLNGLHIRISIARPVNVITIVNIVVMPS